MEREPLDSAEYESTYLELRPDCERVGLRTIPPPALYLCAPTVVRAPPPRRPAGPPVALLRRSTRRPFSAVLSDPLPSRHQARSQTLLGPGVLVVVSTSLGIVAELDVRAVRSLFVALTGVLLFGWARLAWRGTSRPEAFDAAVARVLDRSVTALGTFFAIALWAEYAPQASVAFSKTGVLVMGGIGLIIGVVAAARHT